MRPDEWDLRHWVVAARWIADAVNGTPLDTALPDEPFTRGASCVVRMSYAAFLAADHDTAGGLLYDYHLPDTTVLAFYGPFVPDEGPAE